MMKRVLCVRLPEWPRQRRVLVPPELELSDREALEHLVAWCDAFSPLVGVDTREPPECLFLDVTGLADLFHGEETLAEHVEREFGRRGLTVQLALADTLGAAWALAHFGRSVEPAGAGEEPPLLARSPDLSTTKVREQRQSRLSLRERTSFRGAKGDNARPTQLFRQSLDGQREAPPGKPAVSAGASLRLCPSHQIIVAAGQTVTALVPLPVESLRLSADGVQTLKELGLRQIGQLLRFSRDSLAARFGPELLLRLDQATGAVTETIAACRPTPLVEAEAVFEYPTTRSDMIEQALQRQLDEIVRQLSPRRQGVRELVCRLRGETGRTGEITVGLYRPSASPQHLAELIAMQWQAAHRAVAGPLAALRLSVTAAAPVEYRQQELFGGLARSYDPRQTAFMIDRLSSRLGRSAVVRAKLLPEAQPELAWRYEALVGPCGAGVSPAGKNRGAVAPSAKAGGQRTKKKPTAGRAVLPAISARHWPLSRPLSLVARPLAVEMVSVAPHGPPQTFSLSGERHRVERVWGPERIHTGWWRGRSVRRDYYRVETTTGRWFWLFRQLTDGRWYFHGAFD